MEDQGRPRRPVFLFFARNAGHCGSGVSAAGTTRIDESWPTAAPRPDRATTRRDAARSRAAPPPAAPARPADQANAAPAPRSERDRQRERPRQGAEDGGLERLQKVLAHAGVGSRRACEELILQGRVTVDGQVVRELGTKVDPRRQQVAVDGQKVHAERIVYYAVYKPKGYVSTNNDPAGKPRVVDLLPEIPQRVYTVGRLDEKSTGLMLLTNDGELANKLAHPKFGVEKVYRVVVAGEPGREVLDQLTEGIWLAEGKVRAKRVRVVGAQGAGDRSWRWSWPRGRTARSAGCSPSSATRSCR